MSIQGSSKTYETDEGWITRVAHFDYDYDSDFVTDGPLRDVIKSFQDQLENIPAEYRDTAHCEIESEGGYEGSHSIAIAITYIRPATQPEINKALLWRNAHQENARQRDLALLARLKEQYER